MPDVSRADGTFATNRLSGQMDWPQREDMRDNLFLRDTDLWTGESGGLGARIDNGFAFRHLFQSRDRDSVEAGIVVDDQRGLCDNRRFSVRRSVVVQ